MLKELSERGARECSSSRSQIKLHVPAETAHQDNESKEQDFKDGVHERLLQLGTLDPESDCWLFQGPIPSCGTPVIRLLGQTVSIMRASLWVYVGGFALGDRGVRVRRKACCRSARCFSPEHLAIERRAEGAA